MRCEGNPWIVHFCSPSKPWHYFCRHPVHERFPPLPAADRLARLAPQRPDDFVQQWWQYHYQPLRSSGKPTSAPPSVLSATSPAARPELACAIAIAGGEPRLIRYVRIDRRIPARVNSCSLTICSAMRFAFYSTMTGMLWGGSEELWSRAAQVLLDRGHEVLVNYGRRKRPVPKLQGLEQRGRKDSLPLALPLGKLAADPRLSACASPTCRSSAGCEHGARLRAAVERLPHRRPVDHAMLPLPSAFPTGCCCRRRAPISGSRAAIATITTPPTRGAAQCYFVSEQNRDVIETNLALDLSAAEIVDNPFNVPADAAPAVAGDDRTVEAGLRRPAALPVQGAGPAAPGAAAAQVARAGRSRSRSGATTAATGGTSSG